MLNDVLESARAAGRIIQEVRDGGLEVESKGAAGPVTRADREADGLLRSRLRALDPEAAWLSEETADDPSRLDARRIWIVDPLDGTKEFVKGLPEYAVAVALVDAGAPRLAVVHNPATGATFWAVRGEGAFRDGEPIAVAEGPGLLASRSELARGEFDPFLEAWDVRPTGSIQFKLALVACGVAGVTFSRGPKHEWDVCAGALIVEEAGGRATDVFGDPLAYNRPLPKVRGILAGARAAHARALAQIAATGASDRMAELDDVGHG